MVLRADPATKQRDGIARGELRGGRDVNHRKIHGDPPQDGATDAVAVGCDRRNPAARCRRRVSRRIGELAAQAVGITDWQESNAHGMAGGERGAIAHRIAKGKGVGRKNASPPGEDGLELPGELPGLPPNRSFDRAPGRWSGGYPGPRVCTRKGRALYGPWSARPCFRNSLQPGPVSAG